MLIELLEKKTGKKLLAKISKAVKNELPTKKDGWNFDWRGLYKVEGAEFYKISLNKSPELVEGVLMLTIYNGEMLFMNNIEAAPHNIGNNKKYENIAGCLLAFACRESFERGKEGYHGFLSFDSKTALIELYQKKYGASLALGNKMFFDPGAGKRLMKKYLNITI
ncbi:MAG: hypothetical protein R3B93_00665 [Bacteroidia bacterium]